MIAALIIVFRELIEAGLVVSIVLAATHGVPRRGFGISGELAEPPRAKRALCA